MIYVTTPHGAEDISSFLSCVRYHLHPSYKPNDVVDVAKPPFHLTRLGWGEFPIRVQLHFVDSRRNKLVDVFHQLKVLVYVHNYLRLDSQLKKIVTGSWITVIVDNRL
jgi:transcription initiation factor IIF auxiliary subunit